MMTAAPEFPFDLEEALERCKFTKADLNLMRENLPAEDIPKNLTDKQLLLFLNACKTVDEAIKVIKIHYKCKKNAPEHFSELDPSSDAVKQCFNNQKYFIVPPTKKEDCPIVFHKLTCPASAYYFDSAIRTYCMTTDAALHKYGPRPGIIFVHDMENVGLGHIFRASISSIRKYLTFVQYGLPAVLCRVHVLNVNYLFNKILSILRPFVKKEILEIIQIHQSTMDYEEFYKTWIPKSHLPSDYGGDLKSVDEMNRDFHKELISMKDFYLAEEEQRKAVGNGQI